jgi:hypothetical protein
MSEALQRLIEHDPRERARFEAEVARREAEAAISRRLEGAMDVQDGRVEIAGRVYMPDSRGALVPRETVKPQHQLEDETVRKIIGFARALSAQIARFREHTMGDLSDFDALLAQHYGGRARGGVKGNRTYQSYDGRLKVQVQVAESIAFGPELQIAKGLIDECLTEWSGESRPEIAAVVTRAFDVDKEGRIDAAAIYSLLRLDIDDARWTRAQAAIREAMRVVGSKEYVRFYERDTPEGAWRAITVDLART